MAQADTSKACISTCVQFKNLKYFLRPVRIKQIQNLLSGYTAIYITSL